MPRLEADRLQLAPKHLAELQALLGRHVPGAEVWAYGSRVTGGAHEGSDLDLVLRNPYDPTKAVEGWIELKDAVQGSTLPMLVEIHLWSHLPAGFHVEIERAYVVVQAGDGIRPVAPGEAGGAGV